MISIKGIEKLSKKEKNVLNLILNGLKNNEIAVLLSLKPNTISTMKKNIFYKLGIKNAFCLFKNCIQNENNYSI